MCKTALALAIPLMLVPSLLARDKHPERKQRDQYAQQFASEIEHDGWGMDVFASSPGCGLVCVNHGDHDCLRIVWIYGTVEGVDTLMRLEIQPRISKLKELGFTEVDVLGMDPSNAYPKGMARFSIK